MSEQVIYALKKAAIMIGVAAGLAGLAALTNVLPDLIKTVGLDSNIWLPILGSLVAGAVRWFEGFRDAQRADQGLIQPADVGYTVIKNELADDITTTNVYETSNGDIRVV